MPRVVLRQALALLTATAIAATVVVQLAVPAAAEMCVKRNGDTLACVEP